MRTNIIAFLFTCSIFLRVSAQEYITFQGRVADIKDGYTVHMYNNILDTRDSSKVENGKFHIRVPYTGPSRYLFFSSYDTQVKKGYAPFGILVDKPGEIDIEVRLEEGFTKAKITNSVPHALYEELNQALATADDEGATLAKFVERNNDSYAAVFVLDRLGAHVDVNTRKTLFDRLPQVLQNSYEGKRVADKISGELASKVGNSAPEFTLKNQEGHAISLNDFRGKYVFIDFWASWCGPCREEFPFIKNAYDKYKGKGFEVIGISTDKNTEAWEKAIDAFSLPWVHLLDHSGDQAIALSKYAVTVLPTSYLLDPDGKIIAKDLRGEQLEEQLKKLLH